MSIANAGFSHAFPRRTAKLVLIAGFATKFVTPIGTIIEAVADILFVDAIFRRGASKRLVIVALIVSEASQEEKKEKVRRA